MTRLHGGRVLLSLLAIQAASQSVGCTSRSDTDIVVRVMAGADLPSVPTSLELTWLDGSRGLLRARVPREGVLTPGGPALASIHLALAPNAVGSRRVVIVGRIGEVVVGQGAAMFEVTAGRHQEEVVTLGPVAPDQDADGIPDAFDVCPAQDDFVGCSAGGADAGPDARLAADATPDVGPDGPVSQPEVQPDTPALDADLRPEDMGGACDACADAPPLTAPARAPALQARAASGVQVDLTWTDSNDGETGFVIERALDQGAFARLVEVGAVLAHADTTVSALRRYRYRVAATNAAGTSPWSNLVMVETPAAKLTGSPFGTKGMTADTDFRRATDGDVTSFFYGVATERDIAYTGIDTGTAHVLTLIRFHPRTGMPQAMSGGKFQGSSESATGTFEDIATIATTPKEGWNELALPMRSRPYRWFRYRTAGGAYGNVAEIEFWGGPAN